MTWREQFQEAIATVVLSKGHAAEAYDDRWGNSWVYGTYHHEAEEIRTHSKECVFVATGPGKAIEWSAFTDTFADNEQRHGVYVIASCACGRYTNITWLYERDLGTLMSDLLAVE